MRCRKISKCSNWFEWNKWCTENDVFKKDVYNAEIKNIDKIPGIFNLATSTTFNARVNEVKNEYYYLGYQCFS